MPKPLKTLESVAQPKQARSQQTLERLLDAAQGLLEERGLGGLSIPEVVRRAGSSTGSFYARFTDKNALLRAVEERFFANLERLIEVLLEDGRWDGVATAEMVATCIGVMIRSVDRHAELVRAFIYRSSQEPGFEDEVLRFRESVVTGFRAVLLERRAEMRHPDPEFAIDLSLDAAFAFMQSRILGGGQARVGGRPVDDARLERELTRLFLGYVGIDATESDPLPGLGPNVPEAGQAE